QQSVQEARTVPNLAGDRRIVQLELAASQTAARASGRKVRTPQGSAPGNARSGQLEGQWHRKYTAAGVSGWLESRGSIEAAQLLSKVGRVILRPSWIQPTGRVGGKGEKVR